MENGRNKKATQEGAELAQAARKYGNDLSHDSCEQAFLDGAKWMIDKACEWLFEYNKHQARRFGAKSMMRLPDYTINVGDFRKAMEEQQ